MAILPKVYSTAQAADELGITDGRVRQILRALEAEGRNLGTKAGRAWLLTDEDIEAIRSLPDNRKREAKKSENVA